MCCHMSRHTFATMELTLGADLYTTSQLLGHCDVETTQVYAKIADAKKEAAFDVLVHSHSPADGHEKDLFRP